MATATEPRVWVGCLACYNGGTLRGDWVDATEAGDYSPHGDAPTTHEEWWVFDHEGFAGLISGECSPMEAQRLAELVADLDDDDREAFGAYVSDTGLEADSAALDSWRDDYCGVWDSREEYAQNLAEDIGAIPDDAAWPVTHIDWAGAARDLFMDYSDAPASGGRIHVWRQS